MEIKVGDKFEVLNENITYVVDEVRENIIFHHTIGRFNTIPKSELKTSEMLDNFIKQNFIRKIT